MPSTQFRRLSEDLLARIHPRGAIVAGLALTLASLGAVSTVSAAGNALRVEPPTQSVASGASFTVRVVENAAVATSGAQATVTFDKTKVQITAVTRGTLWGAASILAPANLAPSITKANTTGSLKTIASAYLPPDSVPAGDNDVLMITFTAKACGKVILGLPVGPLDAALLDGQDATYGNNLKVTTTAGTVNVCSTATPPPSASPSAGSSATPAPTDSAPADSSAPSSSPAGSPSDSPSPTDSGLPSSSPGDSPSAAPSAAASPTTSPGSTPAGTDGGPPWIPIGLAVVVIAGVGGLVVRRSMRT